MRVTNLLPNVLHHCAADGSLKLDIINKLGNLLETGDNTQLQHIEQYLIELNLDGSVGSCSDVSSTDSKASGSKASDSKASESKASGSRPSDSKASDSKASGSRPSGSRAGSVGGMRQGDADPSLMFLE